jgi:hypothetical protein
MAFQERKQTFSEGIELATQPFRWKEYDLEGQAIYVRQASEKGALTTRQGAVFKLLEYELGGQEWVRLQYSTADAVFFDRHHANVENLSTLREGDPITMIMTSDPFELRGNSTPQYMIAQISSDKGVVYQSPGFTMQESIEIPKSG